MLTELVLDSGFKQYAAKGDTVLGDGERTSYGRISKTFRAQQC